MLKTIILASNIIILDPNNPVDRQEICQLNPRSEICWNMIPPIDPVEREKKRYQQDQRRLLCEAHPEQCAKGWK